ncbi:MAG: tetratricopeptide repeat protein [Candidatus Hodarchaeales archaeon]|jgi:tetratricopeptide (TPR) repeat protein
MGERKIMDGFFESRSFARILIIIGGVSILVGVLVRESVIVFGGLIGTVSGFYLFNRIGIISRRYAEGDNKLDAVLRRGVEGFNSKFYDIAIDNFENLLEEHRSGITRNLERILFTLLARSYFYQEEWGNSLYYAEKLFSPPHIESFLRKHPLEVHLARIESSINLGQKDKALEAFYHAKKRYGSKPELQSLEKKLIQTR